MISIFDGQLMVFIRRRVEKSTPQMSANDNRDINRLNYDKCQIIFWESNYSYFMQMSVKSSCPNETQKNRFIIS